MTSILRNKFGSTGTRRLVVWGILSVFLLHPLVAMGFTNDVQWDRADFLAGAALLLVLGLTIELAFLLLDGLLTRAAAICTSSVILVLIWADAAVGVWGA